MSVLLVDNDIKLSTVDGKELHKVPDETEHTMTHTDPLISQLIQQAITKISQLEKIANDEGTKAFVYKEELDKCKAQLKKYREITTKSQQQLAQQVKTMKRETNVMIQNGYTIKYNKLLIDRIRDELKQEYG